MNNKIRKKYLVLMLLVISITIIGIPISYANKELDVVRLNDKIDSKMFAMYIRKDNDYVKYEGKTFPYGYVINFTRSYCIDSKEELVEGALTRTNNGISVKSKVAVYCTLYFEPAEAKYLIYKPKEGVTKCDTVQCAIDELYGIWKGNE